MDVRRNAVSVFDDCVVKTGDPELMRLEAIKTIEAEKIAQKTNLFRVPHILDFNQTQGIIKYEFIDGLQALRGIVSENSYQSAMNQVGKSLAAVHQSLTLPQEFAVPLPPEYDFINDRKEVFLHGDFGIGNMFLNKNDNSLVILDWQATRKIGSRATYGTRYFDLAWFIYNMFYRPSSRQRYKMNVPAEQMSRVFLESYFEASNCHCDYNEFISYMNRFLTIKSEARKKGFHFKRRILLIRSHWKLGRFLKSLKSVQTFC